MNKILWNVLTLLATMALWVGRVAPAAVTPHSLISDGAVFQQGIAVPVWGAANDGEKVTVQFQNQKVSTTAQNGKWFVKLAPLKSGGSFTMTINGENTVQVQNLLVGEVWVCSGQSNMEWPLAASADGQTHIAQSHDPMLRLFTAPRAASDTPLSDVKGTWQEAAPPTTPKFSAVAYFFGRDLRKARNVPVGLIQTAVGGTPAEAWTSHPTLAAHPEFKSILDGYAKAVADYPSALEKHQEALAKHKEAAAKAQQEGKQPPAAPRLPYGPESLTRPSGLYNAMVRPLQPYAIRGAIWYQGESNASRAHQYRTLFPAMIRNWRTDWGQGDFPFVFVQLAPFKKIETEPQESDWAELREAQRLTTGTVPHTAMVVITDVGDENDIHPKQKEPVGARLALAARALAHGERITYSGPAFDAMKIKGNRAVLKFKHTGRGLVTRNGELKGFTIAGADRKFVTAHAVIHGNTVEVSSPHVSRPVAVRYGWANYPVVNLANKEGLYASPFRTDDFPMVTTPKN